MSKVDRGLVVVICRIDVRDIVLGDEEGLLFVEILLNFNALGDGCANKEVPLVLIFFFFFLRGLVEPFVTM